MVQKSEVLDLSAIDPWAEISPSQFARLVDRSPSSITRSGKIVFEENGKIVPGKNAIYISKIFSSDQKRMTQTQRGYFHKFFDAVRLGDPGSSATSPAATGPQPYSPARIQSGSICEVGILTDRTFLPVLKIFTGEDHEDGIQALTMQPDITLSIDRNGAIDALFFEDKKIDELFFREVDQ